MNPSEVQLTILNHVVTENKDNLIHTNTIDMIAHRSYISPERVFKEVREMEQLGWVEMTQRFFLISITEKGRECLTQMASGQNSQ